ncbi:MAG: hypothetical protein KME19_13740 [Microcoleus vaginatus WJT46-NPBG5]|nr:hypothetical protein [Microcoleus vaginatus WJT46-NPBG5]
MPIFVNLGDSITGDLVSIRERNYLAVTESFAGKLRSAQARECGDASKHRLQQKQLSS